MTNASKKITVSLFVVVGLLLGSFAVASYVYGRRADQSLERVQQGQIEGRVAVRTVNDGSVLIESFSGRLDCSMYVAALKRQSTRLATSHVANWVEWKTTRVNIFPGNDDEQKLCHGVIPSYPSQVKVTYSPVNV